MTHNDPQLWQVFTEIAETSERMRARAAKETTSSSFPPELKVKAALLAYHLRQVENEARLLAGEKPENAPAAAVGGSR